MYNYFGIPDCKGQPHCPKVKVKVKVKVNRKKFSPKFF